MLDKTSKEKILIEAQKLFAEHGYFAVSMSEIAAKAKMTKSNLYHHFKSKDDLYKQLLINTFDQLKNHLNSYPDLFKKNAFEVAFKKVLKDYIEFGIKNKEVIYILLQQISRLDEKMQAYIYNSKKEIVFKFKLFLEQGIKQGKIKKSLNPTQSAQLLLGLLQMTILRQLRKKTLSKSSITETIEEIYKWLT